MARSILVKTRAGATSSPVSAAEVAAELACKRLFRLAFPAAIEARYEADNRLARAWHIRITVVMGLIAYNAFSLTDNLVLPDLGWLPAAMRMFIITPVGIIAIWLCLRVSAWLREAFISYAICATLLIPVGFMMVSRAKLAPYTMLVVVLVSMFGNITMRIRFHYACLFTALTLAGIGAMLLLRQDLPGLLALHIVFAILTCVSFGLLANNQLERSERRSYLLALHATLRSEQLSADKAVLASLSREDALTGVANRRAFDARLRELHTLSRAGRPGFSLLMIDIDHFKRFNDHYGHQAGDGCLRAVAKILRAQAARSDDMIARYGGEEFAILLPDCHLGDAVAIAENICRALRDAAIAHGNRDDQCTVVSVSIGVATANLGGTDDETEIIRAADLNLYEAKRTGRGQVFPKIITAG